MFLSGTNPSSGPLDTQNQKEVSPEQGAAIGTVVLGIMGAFYWQQNQDVIESFYFNQFETIWGVVSFLALVVIGFFAGGIIKCTKAFGERGKLLSPYWDNEKDRIKIGHTLDGATTLYLPEKERTGHTQIIGSTGRGKTQSAILSWASQDLLKDSDVIIIDGKGSPEIPEALKASAPEAKVYTFNIADPNTSVCLNPLESGTPQEITDRIFTAFEFKEPYYESVQYDICGKIVRLISEVSTVVTFKEVYNLLVSDIALFSKLKKSQNERLKSDLNEFLKSPKSERKKNFSGLISQLSPFAEGEVADLVNGCVTGEKEQLSPSHILQNDPEIKRRGMALVILLPTLKYPKLAPQLGKLLLQEIGWAVGEREQNAFLGTKFTPVFLDEFSSFVYEGFINMLNKARSADIAFHLSHQSLGDLRSVSPEFATAVNTNTNIKCLFGLNDPETADFFARHLGTRKSEKLTSQMEEEFLSGQSKTGKGSLREVEVYKVHPNKLKAYTNGRGVIHFPTENGNLTEEVQFARI